MIPEYQEFVTALDSGAGFVHCVSAVHDAAAPTVVIPSQFEKSLRTNTLLMASLVQCGLNVVRFDFRFHTGESSGDIVDARLSDNVEDLATVLGGLERLPVPASGPLGLIGISMANRTSLRYLATHNTAGSGAEISWYGSMLGVVDLRQTLQSVMGFDVFAGRTADPPTRYGVRKVIKYEIDHDRFADDAIAHGLHDLAGTERDLAQLDGLPATVLLSEADDWVSAEQAAAVYDASPLHLLDRYVIPGGGHLIDKNAEGARNAVIVLANSAAQALGAPNRVSVRTTLTIPELITVNQRERAREAQYRSYR